MSSQYGELRLTSGCDRLAGLGHPSKFQRVSLLDCVTARHYSMGVRQTAALNRGRHLSRWVSANISSSSYLLFSSLDLSCRTLDVYLNSTHGVALVMAALCNRGAIIFLPCSFFPSFFFFFFFFSSPNLSGRRSDVCHTSTHGVALVRI